MKKILFLLLFPSLLYAQESITYTILTPSWTGHSSSSKVYAPGVDATVDSVWTALQSSHVIGSDDVWQATKLGVGGAIGTYKRNQPSLWPYRVAGAFSGGTVTSGSTVVPSGGLGTVAIAQGGTGATTPNAAFAALVADSTGHSGQELSIATGGGFTWKSLNQLLIILADTTGNTGKSLSVHAGGGYYWK